MLNKPETFDKYVKYRFDKAACCVNENEFLIYEYMLNDFITNVSEVALERVERIVNEALEEFFIDGNDERNALLMEIEDSIYKKSVMYFLS